MEPTPTPQQTFVFLFSLTTTTTADDDDDRYSTTDRPSTTELTQAGTTADASRFSLPVSVSFSTTAGIQHCERRAQRQRASNASLPSFVWRMARVESEGRS